MLTEQNSNTGTRYLEIKDFSICEKSRQEREGWEYLETESSDGTKYDNWIKRYKSVDGLITGIEYTTRTLPGTTTNLSSWKILLKDGAERYSFNIPSTSQAASRFVKLAENLDPTQPVEISAWKDNSDAKPKLAFMVKQNGVNIPQKYKIAEVEVEGRKVSALVDYSNPDPENAPKIKVRRNGDKDYSEVEDFLFERMDTVVRPRFSLVEEDTSTSTDDDSSIPF